MSEVEGGSVENVQDSNLSDVSTEGGQESVTPIEETPENLGKKKSGKSEPTGLGKLAKIAKEKEAKARETQVTPPAKTYAPNFKYKVHDKEHEFEEWAKTLIKDEVTEKAMRALHEKGMGIELIKEDRQTLKGELEKRDSVLAEKNQVLSTMGNFLRNRDFDSFFEAVQIAEDDVLKWAVEVAKRREWSPEQKQEWAQNRQAKQTAQHYEKENDGLLAGHRQLESRFRNLEVDTLISRPEIAAVAQAFDTGKGQPGAFKLEVLRYGSRHHDFTGQDMPPEKAIQDTVEYLKRTESSLFAQPEAQKTEAPQIVQPNTKPIIPNFQGRGTSPVRSAFKSIAELNQRRKELEAQAG